MASNVKFYLSVDVKDKTLNNLGKKIQETLSKKPVDVKLNLDKSLKNIQSQFERLIPSNVFKPLETGMKDLGI